jgi:atypical dual specificity phosphatase
LLVVLHHQRQARQLADRVVLMAGGRVQADLPCAEFFAHPPNDLAAQFVRTGSCYLPAPDADPETLAEDIAPPPPLPTAALLAVRAQPEYRGPRGFHWVVPGRLGTAPLPGAVVDIDHDLATLKAIGVSMLITLTRADLPQDRLAAHGLRNLHLPVYDGGAPSQGQLRMLAIRMTRMIQQGEVLAVHCRAGLGRTGTVVAGWLVHEGLTAEAALERLRLIEPGYVQSAAQEAFLHDLETSYLMRL